MRLQNYVFVGIFIIFATILVLPAGSFACWGTGPTYYLECCSVCCETEQDCINYVNGSADYNCKYNYYCLFNPGYCEQEENCPSAFDECPFGNALNSDQVKIETLRRFRDEVLSKTPAGRAYIKLYYQWGPVVVQMMKEDEELKKEVKVVLEELFPLIEEMLK